MGATYQVHGAVDGPHRTKEVLATDHPPAPPLLEMTANESLPRHSLSSRLSEPRVGPEFDLVGGSKRVEYESGPVLVEVPQRATHRGRRRYPPPAPVADSPLEARSGR